MNNQQSLVSINILSYNRINELSNTLTKVYEQDYKNIEVIVVDNASDDGSSEMVSNEFSKVKLIKMQNNTGIAGWNEGFKIAKGEFVLVLDDDSYPDKTAIQKAVNCISENDKIGVVCLNVYNKAAQIFETAHIDKITPNTFIGCGAVIRSNIFKETGLFSDLLFLYEHETEFSMRVYNSGFIVHYCGEAMVYHESSLLNRAIKSKSDLRRKYFLCRNYALILFLHFNLFRIMIFLPQLIAARLFMSIIERNFFTALKGFANAFLLLPKIFNSRLTLKDEIQKFYNYGNYMGRFVRDKRY